MTCTGIMFSRGSVVAFLDDDAVADDQWAKRLLAAYRDSDVVATGGAAEAVLESPLPTWWPSEFDWVVGCAYRGLPTHAEDVRNVIGCNMSVRRAALEAVG